MTGLRTGARFRAAIGLIAAYAIALQTIFAALTPLPVNAQGADFAAWHSLCFGSGITSTQDGGDPASPAPTSGKFHCVLCGLAQASAIIPEAAAHFKPAPAFGFVVFAPESDLVPARPPVRTGSARAPPLTA
jgi:hypothetical protein